MSGQKDALLRRSDSGAFTANTQKILVDWTDSMDLCGDGVLMELTFEPARTGTYAFGLETGAQSAAIITRLMEKKTGKQFAYLPGLAEKAELTGGPSPCPTGMYQN